MAAPRTTEGAPPAVLAAAAAVSRPPAGEAAPPAQALALGVRVRGLALMLREAVRRRGNRADADVRAVLREAQRYRAADPAPAAGPGDDRYLAV